jgi:hypothetical protein
MMWKKKWGGGDFRSKEPCKTGMPLPEEQLAFSSLSYNVEVPGRRQLSL